jgi:hypothetical protein
MRDGKRGGRPDWRGDTFIVLLAALAAVAGVAALLATVGTGGRLGTAATATALPVRTPALPPPVRCGSCWRPALSESWQIELSASPEPPFPPVKMIELDGFDTPAATVAALHRSLHGRGVVCYIDAGTWENWRPDAGQFPPGLLGRQDGGWPGERWLDVARYPGALARIMLARIQMCKSKGFDASTSTTSTGTPATPASA